QVNRPGLRHELERGRVRRPRPAHTLACRADPVPPPGAPATAISLVAAAPDRARRPRVLRRPPPRPDGAPGRRSGGDPGVGRRDDGAPHLRAVLRPRPSLAADRAGAPLDPDDPRPAAGIPGRGGPWRRAAVLGHGTTADGVAREEPPTG